MALHDQVMLAGVLLAVSPALLRTNTAVMVLDLTTEVVETVAAWLFRAGVALAFLGAVAHIVVRLS